MPTQAIGGATQVKRVIPQESPVKSAPTKAVGLAINACISKELDLVARCMFLNPNLSAADVNALIITTSKQCEHWQGLVNATQRASALRADLQKN